MVCSLFIWVSEPTSSDLSALVEPLFTVLNLPPVYCQQLDLFQPTSRGLSAGVHPVFTA